MLTLSGNRLDFRNFGEAEKPFLAHVSTNAALPHVLRQKRAYLVRDRRVPEGFHTYLISSALDGVLHDFDAASRSVQLPGSYDYLADGDVVRLMPRSRGMRVLYRRDSKHNFILLTERCNNYCLMCSQPPKNIDDSWLVGETLELISLMDRRTPLLTLTGGEPTLLNERLFQILQTCKSWLPETSVQVLTNGRRFADLSFARRYAAVSHPVLIACIPVYSDVATKHDYVVQAAGAFDETIRGILNLKRLKQRVEIRVVIHQQTYRRLPELAEFITKNLLFVDHVALMGLELTGFTKANLADLWIDPFDYQKQLREAVERLLAFRMNVSIYNHQLCVLERELWPLARRSISDWKNHYIPACESCKEKANCGGFFASGLQFYSEHIAPIT